jgi:hypothetical protein
MRRIVLAALFVLAPALGWGGAYGADVSGAIDARIHDPVARANGNDDEAPLDVQRYVDRQNQLNTSARRDIGPVNQGDTVPNGTPLHRVPAYPQWGYTNAGEQTIIVNRQTGEVVGAARR